MPFAKEPLSAAKLTIGKVSFVINLLTPLECVEVQEFIRVGLAETELPLEKFLTAEALTIGTIQSAITRFPPDLLRQVADKLFEYVSYRIEGQEEGEVRTLNNDSAMNEVFTRENGLTGLNWYELIARSLALNFLEDFEELQALL